MRTALLLRTLLVVFASLVAGIPVGAQDCGRRPEIDIDFPPPETPPDDEPLYRALTDAFQTDALRLGLLVQAIGDVQPERTDGRGGFRLGAARLKVSGRLDRGFGYKLQAELADGFKLKDARLSRCFGPHLTFDAGQFKPPFSLEALTSTSETDFVGRSRVVEALVPGRRVGAALTAQGASGRAVLRAAVMNGAPGANGASPDGRLLYVGRVAVQPPILGDAVVAGANAAYDDASGRLVVGIDARAALGRWLLAAEALVARTDTAGAPAATATGFYTTLGYSPADDHQVLLRLDHLDGAALGDAAPSTLLVLGYVLTPSTPVRIEANLRVPASEFDLDRTRLLVNFQLAF